MSTMPPPDLLMQISNSPRVEDFVGSFPHVQFEVRNYLERVGRTLDSFESILDFGCGPGRFAYALNPVLRPGQKIYGCDVDARCAAWSAANAGYAEVVNNGLQANLPWPDGQFDFIYALSVFTHLSFEHQMRWAWELIRLLKPGGLLMLTTHGFGHLGPALMDGAGWQRRVCLLVDSDASFVVLGGAGGNRIEGQREVAAFHNREAVALQFAPLVHVLHDHVSRMAGGQSMNLLLKPAGSSAGIGVAEVVSVRNGVVQVRNDTPPVAGRRLGGFVAFPRPRYDLERLTACVTFVDSAGRTQRNTGGFSTPACLGSEHLLRFSVDVSAADAGDMAVSVVDHEDVVIPVTPTLFHWTVGA